MFKVGDVGAAKIWRCSDDRIQAFQISRRPRNQPKEHRAAFVIDSLEAAEEAAVKKG